MTAVSAGASSTYTFTATQTVTITLDPNERAVVSVTRAGRVIYNNRISSPQTIGPFLAADVMVITAYGAAIDYTINGYASQTSGTAGAGSGLLADIPTASASNIGYIYVATDDTNGATAYISNGVSFVQMAAGVSAAAGITSCLWADRGTATLGLIKNITDFAGQTGGNPNVLVIGDGTNWQPFGGSQWLMRNPNAIAGATPGTTSDAATVPPLVTPAGFPNISNVLTHELWYHGSATPIAATPVLLLGGTQDLYNAMGTLRRAMLRRDVMFPTSKTAQYVPQKATDTGYGFNVDNDGQNRTRDFTTQLTHTGSVTLTHASAITTTIDLSRWTWTA